MNHVHIKDAVACCLAELMRWQLDIEVRTTPHIEGGEVAMLCADQKVLLLDEGAAQVVPYWAYLMGMYMQIGRARQLWRKARLPREVAQSVPYEVDADGTCRYWTGDRYLTQQAPFNADWAAVRNSLPWRQDMIEYAVEQTYDCIDNDCDRESLHQLAYWYGSGAKVDKATMARVYALWPID